MDKIKDLLKQLGGSDELTNGIIESIDGFVNQQKTILESDFKERLKAAKAACLEEVNNYKSELARKTQLFFEARADRIEAQIAKQVAIRESASEGTLKQIKALLEGIQVDANGQANLQAVQSKLAEYENNVRDLSRQRDLAVQKANRATNIAEQALKRAKSLEVVLAEAKTKPEPTVTTPTPEKPDKPITEGTEPATAKPTDIPLPVRKSSAQPVTSTPIEEGTIPVKQQVVTEDKKPTKSMKWAEPNSIAALIPE